MASSQDTPQVVAMAVKNIFFDLLASSEKVEHGVEQLRDGLHDNQHASNGPPGRWYVEVTNFKSTVRVTQAGSSLLAELTPFDSSPVEVEYSANVHEPLTNQSAVMRVLGILRQKWRTQGLYGLVEAYLNNVCVNRDNEKIVMSEEQHLGLLQAVGFTLSWQGLTRQMQENFVSANWELDVANDGKWLFRSAT
jgi:hypothetical protein